jgi:DNA-binding HxlR family transcriptional regulator
MQFGANCVILIPPEGALGGSGLRSKNNQRECQMSAKENAAVDQLMELLEARYALRVLWALKDGHPQTFRLLQDSVGRITPNTLNTRIKELRTAGLLHHAGGGYILTALGADLLRRLGELQGFANKWAVSQAKCAAARPSPN